jgi:hypothetical protein
VVWSGQPDEQLLHASTNDRFRLNSVVQMFQATGGNRPIAVIELRQLRAAGVARNADIRFA